MTEHDDGRIPDTSETIGDFEHRLKQATQRVVMAQAALVRAQAELNLATKRERGDSEAGILSLAADSGVEDRAPVLIKAFSEYVKTHYADPRDKTEQQVVLDLREKLTPGEAILVVSDDGELSLGHIATPESEDVPVAIPVIEKSDAKGARLQLRWAVELDGGETVLAGVDTVVGEEDMADYIDKYIQELRGNKHTWLTTAGRTYKTLAAFGSTEIAMECAEFAVQDARAMLRSGVYVDARDAMSGIHAMGEEGLYVDIFARAVDEIKHGLGSNGGSDHAITIARALMSHILSVNDMQRTDVENGSEYDVAQDEPAVFELIAELLKTPRIEDGAIIAGIVARVNEIVGADVVDATDLSEFVRSQDAN